MPGSLVSTRSSRTRISGVPSATITCPACSELPMPTPPPWWKDTHDAPLAVLSSALRIGQSATASVPSFIASVSRNGEARALTEAEPADPRRESLKMDLLARHRDPSREMLVIREQLENEVVGTR